MSAQTMQQRLTWQAYRTVERLGALGLAGVLLLLVAAIAYLFWLRPLQRELETVEKIANMPAAPLTQTQSPEQTLQAYLQSLPDVSARATATQSVIHVAEQQGLMLDEVNYKTEARQDDPLAHYHMRFSLYASYPEIQRFLSQLLHELNYVAIESLSLSRESVQDDVVEANIDLVLHFNQLAHEVNHGD
jgi:Tfp pilus assembly protein PilO